MISITKNYKEPYDQFVEYKLEVFKDNNLIYTTSIEIIKQGITDEQRDTIAKLKLTMSLVHDGPIEIIEELSNLIPVYEEKK